MISSNKRCIAAFDFDGTITTRDSLLPFLLQVTPRLRSTANALMLIPTLIGYRLGMIENHQAKEKLLMTFLCNQSVERLQQQGENFAKGYLPGLVRPAALQRIRWHQQQGHQCILVSAGLEIYLAPWAKTLGFDQVIATQLLVTPEHKINGQIAGRNCYGPEKVQRLLQVTGPREDYVLYAYGDTRGDRELLALADYAFYRQMPMTND